MMKQLRYILLILILTIPSLSQADEFATVTCSSDIPKEVIGKRMRHARVMDVEKAHRAIALKHLGADGMPEDPFVLVSFEICGKEYVFLVDHVKRPSTITDVLPIPSELRTYRQSLPGSRCEQDGKKKEGDIFAILENGSKGPKHPVKDAWRIDLISMKFVKISTQNLFCEN